jgi:FMN phosphatase YigB (HAD superfamily)
MRGKIRCIIKAIIAIILIAIPLLVINYEKNSMSVQNTYLRWDSTGKSAHISAFMTEEVEFNINNVYELEENIKNELSEKNALDRKNEGRSWTDCYSANGKVTIEKTSDSNANISHTNINNSNANITNISMEVEAIGVGGDFFLFHPLQLLSGSYFSTENIMQDLVVIDEDIAWRMFGSCNVEGMFLEINGEKYIISGVIKRDEGRLNKAAGNNKATIYMSYESFAEINENTSITTYEIVMPNLTKDYAKKLLKEKLGLDEKNCEVLDNSQRYSIISLFKIVSEFDTRSMKNNKVCYPYWENVARGKENICALWLVIELIIILIVLFVLVKDSVKFYNLHAEDIQAKWKFAKENVRELPKIIINKFHKSQDETDKQYVCTVIFDIGNVLAEFIPEKYLKSKGYVGKKNMKLMKSVIDTDIWNEYDKGLMTKEELVNRYIEKTPELKRDIENIFNSLEGIVKKFDYTDKWIEELKQQNIRVLYLSNISETLYNDCIEELDFVNKMDGGILSFKEKCIKPDMEIYEKLIDKYNLTAEKCIFIDDREVNVNSGNQAGFNSILFTSYEETNKKVKEIIRGCESMSFS